MTKQNRGWGDDPLVAISGEHVAAVIEESSFNRSEVARAIGISQPRLHQIVSGATKRCRQSVRDQLARKFDVLPEWLGGDENYGPFRNRWLRWLDKDPHVTVYPHEYLAPALTLLRTTRLIEDCLNAWDRDLASGSAPEPNRNSILGRVRGEMDAEPLRAWLGSYLSHLLSAAQTFKPLIYEFPKRLTANDADLVEWWFEQDVVFAASWIAALRALLQPWIDGNRKLDYPAVYRLLQRYQRCGGDLMKDHDQAAFAKVIEKVKRRRKVWPPR